jgi:hypothetical protein
LANDGAELQGDGMSGAKGFRVVYARADDSRRVMRYRVSGIPQNGPPVLLAENASPERVGKICTDAICATAFKAIRVEQDSGASSVASETLILSCRDTVKLRAT